MNYRRQIHAPLLRPALCLAAGIAVGHGVPPAVPALLATFVAAVGLTLAARRWQSVQGAGVCLCFAVLGALLVQREQHRLRPRWSDGPTAFEAVVVAEPQQKPNSVALDVVTADGGRKLKCYVARDARSQSIALGDGLAVRAVVRPNGTWRRGAFDYGRYLEAHGFAGQCYVAAGQWHPRHVSRRCLSRSQRVRLLFLGYRHRLLERQRLLTADADVRAVVSAMTLGDRRALSDQLKEVYNVSGAAHVLALSGLHLSIVYGLLSLLVAGRLWRRWSLTLTIVAVWGFALLVGLPASVVRAAIMLTVMQLMRLGGREAMSLNVWAFTALVMLTVAPLALFDVGFQLSFMSMLGIILLFRTLYAWPGADFLQRHAVVKWLWGTAAVSVSAQLATAPLVAYYFGRFSLVFLLSNFVVVPMATVVLGLSLVALLLPWIGTTARLLTGVVSLMNAALTALSALPCASIEGLRPSVLQVCTAYVILLCGYLIVKIALTGWHPLGKYA